jgi:hypothetical protein
MSVSSLNFLKHSNSSFLNILESKNYRFQFFEKIQNKKHWF